MRNNSAETYTVYLLDTNIPEQLDTLDWNLVYIESVEEIPSKLHEIDCVITENSKDAVEFLQWRPTDGMTTPVVVFGPVQSEEQLTQAFDEGVYEWVSPDETCSSIRLQNAVDNAVNWARESNVEYIIADEYSNSNTSIEWPDVTPRQVLRQLFMQVPVSLYMKDEQGRHLFMSDYGESHSPEDVISKTDLDIYDPSLVRQSFSDDVSVIAQGESIVNREEYNPGLDEWTLTSKVPWFDESENVRGLIGVTRFITDKKKYERQIEQQNERLEEFTGVVSHDLRNPLNVAMGRLQIEQQQNDSENVQKAVDALNDMNDLIDELLELAKQGSTIDDVSTVNISDCMESVLSNFADENISTCDIDTNAPIKADESRLEQLLINLVRNSIEHGDPPVSIKIERNGKTLSYIDDGPGIPQDEIDDIFDPGYTNSESGTGFGLAIVDEIANAHGWEITVDPGYDYGAKFDIRLAE